MHLSQRERERDRERERERESQRERERERERESERERERGQVSVSHDMIGRMMLLSARSPWLATVLDDLMGFEGSELYIKEWPGLVRRREERERERAR